MNFYERCEETFRNNGWDIGQKYDWNAELDKDKPDLTKLVFGVYIDNDKGEAWDIYWTQPDEWNPEGYFVAKWLGEHEHEGEDDECDEEEEEAREDESGETLEELMLSI